MNKYKSVALFLLRLAIIPACFGLLFVLPPSAASFTFISIGGVVALLGVICYQIKNDL